ncbi:MAG TPA: hypothetical protein VEQ85_10800 [Lacipirellulaceae bacterium]|nr:hypothetical protein [Lacipirellulaceae bacterium]
MPSADVIRAIHASGCRAVLAVTGGGSGAISRLLEVPGASRTVLAAAVPYSAAALARWLGAKPEQSCSAATARAMAMVAFVRARELAPQEPAAAHLGVACSASLASDRPKRGEHRIHVATHSSHATAVWSITLAKGRRTRAEEEAVAAGLVLDALAAGSGLRAAGQGRLAGLDADERLERDEARATDELAQLLVGQAAKVILGAGPAGALSSDAPLPVVFPGAFNPVHAGHLRMAAAAEARLGLPAAWELSVTNVDKPALDFIAIRDRVAGLQGDAKRRPIALTRAATFREKAALFPGSVFVVGADTLVRIGDVRYYGGETLRRDAVIREIAAQSCRFLAFGRVVGGQFQRADELDLPAALRALCDVVPESEFRADVSSTELRARQPE